MNVSIFLVISYPMDLDKSKKSDIYIYIYIDTGVTNLIIENV
jgi:hypothetical protein